jgi:ribosomal protein L31
VANVKTISGFIQFEPQERTTQTGKTLTRVTLQSVTSGKNVDVTVWGDSHPNFSGKRGDYMIVQGDATSKVGQNKDGEEVTYHNLSAYDIVVLKAESKVPKGQGQQKKAESIPEDDIF